MTKMKRSDARVLLNGLFPEGYDVRTLTPNGKREVIAAIDKILELTETANDTVLAPDRPQA